MGCIIIVMASGYVDGMPGFPVADIIEVSDRARDGFSPAIAWAIIPPIDPR